MRHLLPLFFAILLPAAWVSSARADLLGIPNSPVPAGAGFSLLADYGDPEGGSSAWGLSGAFGLGRLGFMADIGTLDTGADDVTTFGAAAGLSLLQLGPVGVGAQLNSTWGVGAHFMFSVPGT